MADKERTVAIAGKYGLSVGAGARELEKLSTAFDAPKRRAKTIGCFQQGSRAISENTEFLKE